MDTCIPNRRPPRNLRLSVRLMHGPFAPMLVDGEPEGMADLPTGVGSGGALGTGMVSRVPLKRRRGWICKRERRCDLRHDQGHQR